MQFILDLWLPILSSSVIVFFAAALMWMALPHHKADIKPIPNEEAFAADIARHNLPQGLYMWPNCQEGETPGSESYKERFNKGPWGVVTIIPKPNFARNLLVSYLIYLVVSIGVAYLGHLTIPAGSDYLFVFRVTGTAAFLAYCTAGFCTDVFLGRPLRFMLTSLFDGLVYAMLTAGAFAGFWPDGPAAGALPMP